MVLSNWNCGWAGIGLSVMRNIILILSLIIIILVIPTKADLSVSQITWSYNHISSLTTTTPKSAAGTLHSIVVNSSGSVPCTIIIYDSTTVSGSQIAAIDCSSRGQLTYDTSFTTGLTIVTTSTATPAIAPDITATFQ
jgi:hypothetical protein